MSKYYRDKFLDIIVKRLNKNHYQIIIYNQKLINDKHINLTPYFNDYFEPITQTEFENELIKLL